MYILYKHQYALIEMLYVTGFGYIYNLFSQLLTNFAQINPLKSVSKFVHIKDRTAIQDYNKFLTKKNKKKIQKIICSKYYMWLWVKCLRPTQKTALLKKFAYLEFIFLKRLIFVNVCRFINIWISFNHVLFHVLEELQRGKGNVVTNFKMKKIKKKNQTL